MYCRSFQHFTLHPIVAYHVPYRPGDSSLVAENGSKKVRQLLLEFIPIAKQISDLGRVWLEEGVRRYDR